VRILALAVLLSSGAVAVQPADDVVITLERTTCFGSCPAYTVTVTGDGRVEYEGRRFVHDIGRKSATISRADVARLMRAVERARYFDLEDRYTAPITDNPTTITTVRAAGRFKRVIDYIVGPPALKDLEHAIDVVAGTSLWVIGANADSVRREARRGWRASGPDGREYVDYAVETRNVDLLKALIEAGADPKTALDRAERAREAAGRDATPALIEIVSLLRAAAAK
jgi:hypothetical protein